MSSARMRLATTVCVALGAVVLGVVAEWVAYSPSEVRWWATDLAVGWGLVALGLVGRRVAEDSRCGVLLCAAGYAWFAGNFASIDVAAVAWVGSHGAYVHRALLAHAIVDFPRGRLGSPLRRSVVAFVYVASLWPALATSDAASIAVGVAVLVAATISRHDAAPAALAFAVAVGGVAADRLFLAPSADRTLLLYEAGLLAAGTLLVVPLWRRASASTVTDRVVELGETATVREALRSVLGDPSLEVGFLREEGYVDERGRALGSLTPTRRVTALDPLGEAILIHDPSTPVLPSTATAVSRALVSLSENARLQAEARAQLAELRASRRRLVLARGRQRAVLAHRLRGGVEPHLAEIGAALAGIDHTEPALAGSVERASGRLAELRETIAALARGLQPPALAGDGLAGALHALAATSPVAVSLTVDERRFDAAVEHAGYLVCSEALTNVAKHSRASAVEVRVLARDGRLRLEISDNGNGRADPHGSGLRGLAERVEELGGTLRIESPPGRGTRLTGEIPLRTERDLDGVDRDAVSGAPLAEAVSL